MSGFEKLSVESTDGPVRGFLTSETTQGQGLCHVSSMVIETNRQCLLADWPHFRANGSAICKCLGFDSHRDRLLLVPRGLQLGFSRALNIKQNLSPALILLREN